MKLNCGKTALVVGFFVSFMHLVWLVMVWSGLGQAYLDWILGLHQVSLNIRVLPFNLMNGVYLLIVTFIVGYLMGWMFAYIWNRLIKGK
ncbi:MAG TPA: hypothetical protein VLE44_02620 [Candidatus Saccharimonadales bacterium]|nr:hypothetical protein [Candidatus Saccharimonadales bacterium]